MKFVGNPDPSGVSWHYPNLNVEELLCIIHSVSREVGDETREKLHAAIKPSDRGSKYEGAILFWDTPIWGDYYVYLWFDKNNELFYIGKGTGNRAYDMYSRSEEYKTKASGGRCVILAALMKESYALDLEKILILEAVRQGITLLNKMSCDGIDAVQYCSGDRDALLWYWDGLGVISRFAELTGMNVTYDARSGVDEALGERLRRNMPTCQQTNDIRVIAEIQATEEKKRMQREKQRNYRQKRKEQAS